MRGRLAAFGFGFWIERSLPITRAASAPSQSKIENPKSKIR
jgi:hypothetical protein